MKKGIKIFPSLIAADPLNLEYTVQLLEPHCEGFHVDVMDNHFVPNLTWGPFMVNALANVCKKPLFVHLMVENPGRIVERLILKPASFVSFHIESKIDFFRLIDCIKEKNLMPSLAISPKTPLGKLEPFLAHVESILLMSVEPGFSGQSFLGSSIQRLQELVEYRKKHYLTFEIAMDGGIGKDNIAQLARNGCTSFCIASAIFGKQDPAAALDELYALVA